MSYFQGDMDITVEKIVWVVLALLAASMVGMILFDRLLPGTEQVGQRFYVRLIKSSFVENLPITAPTSYWGNQALMSIIDADRRGSLDETIPSSGYVVSLRIVNGGEGGPDIVALRFTPVGFGVPENPYVFLPDGTDISDGYFLPYHIPPKGTSDVTVLIPSNYVDREKVLIVTATFNDGTESSQSVPIP